MTYYGAKELAESFRTVRKNTLQAAEEIPESQYGFKAAGDTRTVEKLLAHIALGYRFQHQIHAIEKRTNLEGFNFPALMMQLRVEEEKPRTKAEVITLLKEGGETWAAYLEGLTEDLLATPFMLPAGATPPSKSLFEMILSVKEHEMHHRGQIMLIQRMIGLVPHLTREMQARMAQAQMQAGQNPKT